MTRFITLKILVIVLITVVCLSATSASAALIVGDVINIDLQRSSNGFAATGNDGPFTQGGSPTWNVFNSDSGTASGLSLLDAGGEDDGVTFSATGGGSWRSSDYSTAEPNRVTYDYWFRNTSDMPFSIDNLSAGSYDLYILAGMNTFLGDSATTSDVTITGIGTETISWAADEGGGGNTGLPSPWTEGTNFLKFHVDLASPGSITGTVHTASSGTESVFNGLQLVVVPEPSSLALATLGLLSLGMTRRRRH